jgi:hypothetical protein
VRILSILGGRARASWGRSDVAQGSMKISDKPLRGGWIDAGADNTLGGIAERDTRGITIMMEMHTDAYPQGDFSGFDGSGQIAKKSGRRRDYGGDEDPKGEGEASDNYVEWLGEGEGEKTVREQDVVGVPSMCEQRG